MTDQPKRCETCGSDDPHIRLTFPGFVKGTMPCINRAFHDAPAKIEEQPERVMNSRQTRDTTCDKREAPASEPMGDDDLRECADAVVAHYTGDTAPETPTGAASEDVPPIPSLGPMTAYKRGLDDGRAECDARIDKAVRDQMEADATLAYFWPLPESDDAIDMRESIAAAIRSQGDDHGP